MKSTLIVATVLAGAFVAASALPTLAEKNNGGFQQSSEGNKGGGACTTYLDVYKGAAADMRSSSKELRTLARNQANEAIRNAFALGCAWVDGV